MTRSAAMTKSTPPLGYDLLGEAGDFPPWDGPPSRCCLLCTSYRSGSSLLGEALRGLGGFGAPMEYFDESLRPAFAARWNAQTLDTYQSALFQRRTDPTGAFGAKLDWPRLMALCVERDPAQARRREVNLLESPEQGQDILRAVGETVEALFPAPRFIFLTRRDKLRQAVSWVRARQTRQFWSLADTGSPAPEPVYDYDKIRQSLAQFAYAEQCLERFFAHSGLAPVRVVYEDLAADYFGTLRRVVRELDGHVLPNVPLPRLRKQSDAASEAWLRRFLEEHRTRLV